MAKGKRSKELSEIIGEYVRIHFKGNGPTTEIAEIGALVQGLEGYVIDVTDNFMYIGNDLNNGYNAIIDVDNINLIEITQPTPQELLVVRDPDEEVH